VRFSEKKSAKPVSGFTKCCTGLARGQYFALSLELVDVADVDAAASMQTGDNHWSSELIPRLVAAWRLSVPATQQTCSRRSVLQSHEVTPLCYCCNSHIYHEALYKYITIYHIYAIICVISTSRCIKSRSLACSGLPVADYGVS